MLKMNAARSLAVVRRLPASISRQTLALQQVRAQLPKQRMPTSHLKLSTFSLQVRAGSSHAHDDHHPHLVFEQPYNPWGAPCKSHAPLCGHFLASGPVAGELLTFAYPIVATAVAIFSLVVFGGLGTVGFAFKWTQSGWKGK